MQARGVDRARLISLSAFGTTLVALVILAWSLARLTWVIVGEPGYNVTINDAVANRAGEARSSDFTVLERITPFPRAAKREEGTGPVSIEAPETSLDLVLHGVLMRADTGGVAYISVGEAGQKSYRVGDTIDAVGGVLVRRILPGAVILERDGQQERLASGRPGGAGGDSIVTLKDGQRPENVPAADVSVPGEAQDMDSEASSKDEESSEPAITRARATMTRSEAEELAQSIRFDERTGGVDGGFSVFPTRRAELFARAGLKSGDVIQEVGGIRLDTVADFEKVFADLETQSQIDVRLVRRGTPRLLTLQLRDTRGVPEGD